MGLPHTISICVYSETDKRVDSVADTKLRVIT